MSCSVARTLEAVGDRWSLLIMRDAFFGVKRFDDFQRDLEIARNILSRRLSRLVEQGLMERQQYSERPARFEYRLTAMGRDLFGALVLLQHWGDTWVAGAEGPPRNLTHLECGHETHPVVACRVCDGELTPFNTRSEPVPEVLRDRETG